MFTISLQNRCLSTDRYRPLLAVLMLVAAVVAGGNLKSAEASCGDYLLGHQRQTRAIAGNESWAHRGFGTASVAHEHFVHEDFGGAPSSGRCLNGSCRSWPPVDPEIPVALSLISVEQDALTSAEVVDTALTGSWISVAPNSLGIPAPSANCPLRPPSPGANGGRLSANQPVCNVLG